MPCFYNGADSVAVVVWREGDERGGGDPAKDAADGRGHNSIQGPFSRSFYASHKRPAIESRSEHVRLCNDENGK